MPRYEEVSTSVWMVRIHAFRDHRVKNKMFMYKSGGLTSSMVGVWWVGAEAPPSSHLRPSRPLGAKKEPLRPFPGVVERSSGMEEEGASRIRTPEEGILSSTLAGFNDSKPKNMSPVWRHILPSGALITLGTRSVCAGRQAWA